jgi:hypothetical protein
VKGGVLVVGVAVIAGDQQVGGKQHGIFSFFCKTFSRFFSARPFWFLNSTQVTAFRQIDKSNSDTSNWLVTVFTTGLRAEHGESI